MVLFGIPFTAFALFWLGLTAGFGGGAGPGPPGFFVLFGIPFVIIGLGMLTSPFWMFLKALRTAYAITDRRALTLERGLWGQVVVRSFDPANLAVLARPSADGSGNLVFRREYRFQGRNGRFVEIGFLAVPDVKEVKTASASWWPRRTCRAADRDRGLLAGRCHPGPTEFLSRRKPMMDQRDDEGRLPRPGRLGAMSPRCPRPTSRGRYVAAWSWAPG